MVTHRQAMKLRYNKATLHHLPPVGRRWKWGDVVGDADGKVDPTDAHAARPYLESHGGGVWEATRRLAEYLDEKYSIELEGDVTAPEQSTLPGAGDDGRVVTDGSGSRTVGESGPPGHPARATGRTVQVGLDGEPAEDAVAAMGAREDIERFEAHGDRVTDKAVAARRDAGQATLGAFRSSATAGRFRRATGQVYSGPTPA